MEAMPTDSLLTSPWILGDDEHDLISRLRPYGAERCFAAGAALFEQGETPAGIFCLLEGSVKYTSLSPEGAERLLMVVGPGCLVGEVGTLDGGPAQVAATAVGEVTALFVERQGLLEAISHDPELALRLSLSLARKLRATMKLVVDKSFRSVSDQMACLLHQICVQKGPDQLGRPGVTVPMSHQELADALGVSRVAVSQAVAALKERGLVETGHRAVYVPQPAHLRCCGLAPMCVSRWRPGMALAGD